MRQLDFIFPDYDIMVFLNGHYNLPKQIRYLQAATSFLAQYPNVRYLTQVTHQPLARAWNWLIMMAAWDQVLILNDDLTVHPALRHNLENLAEVSPIFTLNSSWSHFVIHKKVIAQVGWFDENLRGIGYEDNDYIFRLGQRGIRVRNVLVDGVLSLVAPSTDASWADISGVTLKKYSQANLDYLLSKWAWSAYEEVSPVGAFPVFCEHDGREWLVRLKNPDHAREASYPGEALHFSGPSTRVAGVGVKRIIAKACSLINSWYWRARHGLGAFLRRQGLLEPWWGKVKAWLGR